MELFSELKEIIDTRIIYLATASRDGVPNVVPMGGKQLIDQDTLLIVDVRMNRTRANILENPLVALVIEDLTRKKPVSLQVKGTATFYEEGEYLEMAKTLSDRAWARKSETGPARKRFSAKAALVIKITGIYCNMRGGARVYPAPEGEAS
jgi:predicted pyridoxine 5'-phosphate oxidase superfamily flavin-nucleotide-binding protein